MRHIKDLCKDSCQGLRDVVVPESHARPPNKLQGSKRLKPLEEEHLALLAMARYGTSAIHAVIHVRDVPELHLRLQ